MITQFAYDSQETFNKQLDYELEIRNRERVI